jgi:hypothetical protein
MILIENSKGVATNSVDMRMTVISVLRGETGHYDRKNGFGMLIRISPQSIDNLKDWIRTILGEWFTAVYGPYIRWINPTFYPIAGGSASLAVE